jgi:hypothetical protein
MKLSEVVFVTIFPFTFGVAFLYVLNLSRVAKIVKTDDSELWRKLRDEGSVLEPALQTAFRLLWQTRRSPHSIKLSGPLEGLLNQTWALLVLGIIGFIITAIDLNFL